MATDPPAGARHPARRLLAAFERVPLRRSLRLKVLAIVAAAVLAPQALIAGWFALERAAVSRMLTNATFAAHEARPAFDGDAPAVVEAVARAHRVRVRLVGADGAVIAAADHDDARDLGERMGSLLMGRGAEPTAGALDGALGPLLERAEVVDAKAAGEGAACEATADAAAFVCRAVIWPGRGQGPLLYVEDAARRPIVHLSYLQYAMPRLLLVTLPLALLLALWMGRHVVRPLEDLRRQALSKASEANPRADLAIRRGDEMQDVAAALNALLAAIEERRNLDEAFVADLVHELKNPVATVRACAEALEQPEAQTPERTARIARLLDDSSRRLGALVTQFLELARAEAGLGRESWSELDLTELVRGRVAALREEGRYPGVVLEVEADAPAPIHGVAHGVESVVRNLLENAASFSEPEGRVTARVAARAGVVELTVTDTGPGIAPEDVAKLFSRFYTTRGDRRGSGLGLAIARAVVEAHGGTIGVQGAPGRGATFVVRLPAA